MFTKKTVSKYARRFIGVNYFLQIHCYTFFKLTRRLQARVKKNPDTFNFNLSPFNI